MQTKIVTLVVLALVCFTSALRVVNQNEDKTLACCGSSATYDTTKQICCITNVVPIPTPGSGLQDVCCGNRLLRETEQCCEAVPGEPSILDRAIDSSATCCGTNALTDPSSQFCCDGTVVTNPNNLNQCCGKRLITSDDLCCSGTVVVGGTAAGKQCCGSTAFDPSTQSCCEGRVQSTTNGNQCCGTGTFNPATQTCCGGKTTTGTGLTCCGDRGFDPSTQICCDNELSGESSVFPNPNGNLQCCGNARTFDPTSQTCCFVDQDNYVKDGKDDDGCAIYVNKPKRTFSVGNVANGDCCNGVAYNPATSLCCLDRVVNNPNNKQCCGRNLFDPSQDLCCPDADDLNAKVIAGRADDGVQCCGTTTFNPTTQGCACEKVVSISNDLFQSNTNPNVNPGCCGATQFDQNDKLCCSSANGNYLFNLDPAAGLKCCEQDGKTVYNPGYQVCCKKEKKKCPGKPSTPPPVGYVSPSSASNSPNQDRDLIQCGDSCCEGVGFFKMFQKCCEGEVVDFNNDAGSADTNPLACCGKTIYNQIFESCCTETVNGKTNNAVYGGPGNWQLCCKNE